MIENKSTKLSSFNYSKDITSIASVDVKVVNEVILNYEYMNMLI